MTSPDDPRDRMRDLDDTSAVPEADRARAGPSGPPADRPDGVGATPAHAPASEAMPGTSEKTAPAEGMSTPEDGQPGG